MQSFLLVLALCAGFALLPATADWKSQVAVSNLASGGQPLFFNYAGSTFSLKEGGGGDTGVSAPPPAAQSFDFSTGFPNSVFTIKTGSKYVQLVGKTLTVSSTIAAAANPQWTRTSYGQFVSVANSSYCIDVASTTKNAKIVAALCVFTKQSQQWVVLPSADSGFTGTLQLWDTSNPGKCLQGPFSPIPFSGTVPGLKGNVTVFPMPTLSPCDPSNPYQQITAISADFNAMASWTQPLQDGPGGFATAWFQLQFVSTKVCITFTQPFIGQANVGRDGLEVILVDCDGVTDPATSGHYQFFGYDSRGQLQSALVPPSTQNVNNIVVNCLSNDGRYAADNVNDLYYKSKIQGSDCSFLKFSNRWSFLDPNW